jgi:2-oxo-4-hydroxy-4-carboxy--5-ureidoimidazoline (OHCU) decarboxylase
MAVKGRSKEEILTAFEERLRHDPEHEFERAVAEIETIVLLRLKERLPPRVEIMANVG